MKPKILLTLVCAALLLSACSLFTASNQSTPTPVPIVAPSLEVVAEGHVVPEQYAGLGFVSGGRVLDVPVTEGQDVAAGEVLARLDGRPAAEAALEAAKVEQVSAQKALNDLQRFAQLQTAQAQQALAEAQKAHTQALDQLDGVDTQTYRDALDEQKIKKTDAETVLKDAREEFDKYKDLDADNQKRKNAQTALDNAQTEFDRASRDYDLLLNNRDMAQALLAVAEAHLQDAEEEYSRRASGPDAEELSLAQASLTAADAHVQAAQKALDDLELKAPFAGRVAQVKVTAGELAAPLQPVVLLMSQGAWYVETSDLTEMDVVNIEAGQAVTVTPDALPDLELKGSVESISDRFSEQSGDITYTVRIRLDDRPDALRWGMTVTVNIPKKR